MAKFEEHLDRCTQCREEVFNLCPEGERLLLETVDATLGIDLSKARGLLQWNTVLRNGNQI